MQARAGVLIGSVEWPRTSRNVYDAFDPVDDPANKLPQSPGAASVATEGPIGRRNVVWGWVAIPVGAISGSILMAWSFAGPFDPPPGFHDYADLSRRMIRLAHIATFMLPIINILLGKEVDRLHLPERWKEICSWTGIIGMIGIPLGLTLGALITIQLKYVAVPGVAGLTISLLLAAAGKVRRA